MDFERTERDYSAKEAAELTGVSQTMQRDWRRHGYISPTEPGKKKRFSLNEICILALAKVQTDVGKPVPAAIDVAKYCVGVARVQIELCQVGVGFEGIEPTPADRRKMIYYFNDVEDGEPVTRYVFFPTKNELHSALLPDVSGEKHPTAYHFRSLAEMEEQVVRNWVTGQIFDLLGFAMSLAAKLKGEPLITYKLIEASK